MCGIAGIYSKTNPGQAVIADMTNMLLHRGPDAHATYTSDSKTLSLGHTRLSIIDLSQEANQPMRSADDRYVIVLNGEIYNFKLVREEIKLVNPDLRFKTNSDTEVVLNAFITWGHEMVNRLEGMFAVALYDTNEKKLFLFRDRIGKKPIFYFSDPEHFVFASEIKAMLRHPVVAASNGIDQQAIHEFLHLGYIPEPKTIYRAIAKFPAGCWAEVSSDLSIKIHSYWAVNGHLEGEIVSDPRKAKEALRVKLDHAVQKRLVSDVPVGSFLSGGTDSSLVTAIASRHAYGNFKTFNIGFKDQAFDEHHYAAKVATCLKTEHYEYLLEEREAAEILETCLHHFDEPFADTSAIPTMLVSKLARKEVVVALTGDGGDELFLGYGSYTWANRLSNHFFRSIQEPLSYGLRHLGNDRLKRISELLRKVDTPGLRSHIFSQEQYFFSDEEIKNLLINTEYYKPFAYEDPLVHRKSFSPADKQAIFDLKYYLKDDLLVKVDRASMFHALECRCPLLDSNVIEYALLLSDDLKKKRNVSKWILKEILEEYIPKDLIHRPKWGFSIPLARWLKNDFHYLLDKYLNSKTLEESGLVRADYVKKLISSFMGGETYLYNRIWILIVLHKWIKDNS